MSSDLGEGLAPPKSYPDYDAQSTARNGDLSRERGRSLRCTPGPKLALRLASCVLAEEIHTELAEKRRLKIMNLGSAVRSKTAGEMELTSSETCESWERGQGARHRAWP